MTDDADRKPTKPLRIAVSDKLREYLGYLARTTTMGASENDVALHILTERLEQMRRSDDYRYRWDREGKPDPS